MFFRMRQIRKLAALAAIVWTLPIAGHVATPHVGG